MNSSENLDYAPSTAWSFSGPERVLYGVLSSRSRPSLPEQWDPEKTGLELLEQGPLTALLGVPRRGRKLGLEMHLAALAWALDEFGNVLPVRPAPPLPSTDAVRAVLAENRDAILAELERLSGFVQLELRTELSDPGALAGRPSSGTEYLRRWMPGEGLVAAAGPAFRRFDLSASRLSAERKLECKAGRLAVSYLVKNSKVPDVLLAFDELQGELCGGPEVRLLGPLVPLSFASLSLRQPPATRTGTALEGEPAQPLWAPCLAGVSVGRAGGPPRPQLRRAR